MGDWVCIVCVAAYANVSRGSGLRRIRKGQEGGGGGG